jgi:hypothetical protein
MTLDELEAALAGRGGRGYGKEGARGGEPKDQRFQ